MSFAAGPFGFWSISFDPTNRCKVKAYLDISDKTLNKALFDEMAADAERWTADTGLPLNWQRRDDRRYSSIAVQDRPISFDDADARSRAHTWATDVIVKMYDTLNEPLRSRALQLRQGAPVL